MTAIVLNWLLERLTVRMPAVLGDLTEPDVQGRWWVLVGSPADCTITRVTDPDVNPLRDALERAVRPGVRGTAALEQRFTPVEQLLCYAFVPRPVELVLPGATHLRRAHVLRDETGVRVGRWRIVDVKPRQP